MTRPPSSHFLVRWGRAWTGLAAALGVHVTDEALTGFLPAYNQVVRSWRESTRWLPPGALSSPVLLAAAIALLISTHRARAAMERSCRG